MPSLIITIVLGKWHVTVTCVQEMSCLLHQMWTADVGRPFRQDCQTRRILKPGSSNRGHVLYCTVLHYTALYCAVLCCTVLYCVQIVTLCSVVCSGGPLNWWSQAISYQIKWCHISEDTYLSSQSPCLYYWRKIDKAIFLQLSLTVFTQNFRKMAKLI